MLLMVEFESPKGAAIFVNVASLLAVTEADFVEGAAAIFLNTQGEDHFEVHVKGTPKEVMDKIKGEVERAMRGQKLMQGVPR